MRAPDEATIISERVARVAKRYRLSPEVTASLERISADLTDGQLDGLGTGAALMGPYITGFSWPSLHESPRMHHLPLPRTKPPSSKQASPPPRMRARSVRRPRSRRAARPAGRARAPDPPPPPPILEPPAPAQSSALTTNEQPCARDRSAACLAEAQSSARKSALKALSSEERRKLVSLLADLVMADLATRPGDE
jgi:hypothetical protein